MADDIEKICYFVILKLIFADNIKCLNNKLMEENKKVIGKIAQVIGAVVDVTFDSQEQLPRIYDALEVTRDNGEVVVFECQQDIGENTMRCIAMDSTDGLYRGMDVVATGHTIRMPAANINGFLNSTPQIFVFNIVSTL